jgi:hypothetical protein
MKNPFDWIIESPYESLTYECPLFHNSGRTYESLFVTASIRYRGNVFTEPLRINELFRIYSLLQERAYRILAQQ